jgi:hypothetical protein
MSKLGDRQKLFTYLVPRLLDKMHNKGYECTFGDAYRDARVFGQVGEKKGYGYSKSLHKSRCAIDLNLFKDGVYLTKTEDHKPFGDFWKSLDPLCEWGGDFGNKDGNHYQVKLP